MRWSDNRTGFAEVAEARPYLYRAVDKYGKTVDSLLCGDRSMFAAEEFFRKAVARQKRWPRNINVGGNAASHRTLRLLRKQDPKWRSVVVLSRLCLNNIVEQDHRAIKRRCLLIASNGYRYWRCQYRFGGRQKNTGVGRLFRRLALDGQGPSSVCAQTARRRHQSLEIEADTWETSLRADRSRTGNPRPVKDGPRD